MGCLTSRLPLATTAGAKLAFSRRGRLPLRRTSIGAPAAPAVSTLVTLLPDKDQHARPYALAVTRIGVDLKAQDTVLWWVVPRVYLT